MELSRIGSDLLGPTESRVLAALARLADPVSGRQLTKLAGADSHSTVRRYLARLRDIGLVHATETPSATLFELNRRHVFWAPIEGVLAASARIEQEIATLVLRQLGSTARVAVFGSVAAGTADAESDYDLLLLVEDSVTHGSRTEAVKMLGDLVERLTGNECQVVDISATELRNLVEHNSPIAQEWMENAKPIDGRGRMPQLQGIE